MSGESADVVSSGPQSATDKFVGATKTNRDDSAEEETLWEGTFSGKAMLDHYLIGSLIMIVLLVVGFYFNQNWIWWTTLGSFLVVWGYILYAYVQNRLGVRYRLTSHRFFHEKGILLHKTDLIEVIDIDDITYTRTIIERIMGVGTIKIDSSDRSHPQLSIPGISNVEKVAQLFQDARHRERRRRAVHIESV